MKEALKEITLKAIEEFGDHIKGCVIIGGTARGEPGDIDVIVVVDKEELIGEVKELEKRMDRNYDLHPTTLEAFESKLFL